MSLISRESQVFISFLLSFHICHQHCQKKKQIASSSVQDIKRHLKKRATQSNKKSGHSGSPSSESSCSVVTKEDSCLLDDLLVNARFYIRMSATPQFTYFFPPFFRPANPNDPSSAPPPPGQPSIAVPKCLHPKQPAGRAMQRKK